MIERIHAEALAAKNDLIATLRELVAIPSLSGQEQDAISLLKEKMQRLDYDEVWIDPLGNLFGRIGSGKRVIAIDGHCDTVDIGVRDNWSCDPFEGDFSDNYVYGRGSADQKGGLVSALYAGSKLKKIGLSDEVSLLVVASVLEEDFEGLCWQYIVEKDEIRPEAVLLTEPSELGIRIGQRGRMEMKVRSRGISCHGSAPERGDNAIYKLAPILQDIERLNHSLTSESPLGVGSVAVTNISATSPSLCAVPDNAELHLDRRVTEGETLQSCVDEIKNLPSVIAHGAEVSVPEYDVASYTETRYPVTAYYPIWLMDSEHPLVRTAASVYRSQFGRKPDLGTWVFSTNGVATKGMYDIPTIGFGPGEEKYAHAPDERVNADDLVQAMAFYTSFVLEWAKEL